MSRSFAKATADTLRSSSTPVTAAPLTLACWFWVNDVATSYNLVEISLAAATSYFKLLASSADVLLAWAFSPSDSEAATSITNTSANTWHHACGVFAATDSRSVYLDGGGKATDVDSATPVSLDEISIGRDRTGFDLDGRIAEFGIWNAALTDAEVASLAAGYTPPFVRPQNLVLYMPLVRDNDQDLVGGIGFIPSGTGIAVHPRILYPAPALFPHPDVAPATFDVQGRVFTYTAANWPGLTWYYEVDMRATAGTARTRLWDITADAAVVDSGIQTTSSTFARRRSSALTLTDGHKYRAEFGALLGATGETYSATIIGI